MRERSLRSLTGTAASVAAVGALFVGCAQNPASPTALIGSLGAGSPTPAAVSATNDQIRVRTPISFTLSSCPSLPAGVTVSGTGDDFLDMNVRVDADGTTQIERNDLAIGTAVDSTGANYKFNYHNHSNISVPAGGFPWSFTTTDHFNLIGNGHADQLQVHFVARVTFTSPADPPIFEFVNERGNPFFCDAL
jgi:hypothetical protein